MAYRGITVIVAREYDWWARSRFADRDYCACSKEEPAKNRDGCGLCF